MSVNDGQGIPAAKQHFHMSVLVRALPRFKFLNRVPRFESWRGRRLCVWAQTLRRLSVSSRVRLDRSCSADTFQGSG